VAIFEFKLPELGEGIHEGEIVKWHVQPGDEVEEDQIILEVQNDKAVVEVPSPVNGKVKELVVSEGTVSIVGDTLVTFEVAKEDANTQSNDGDKKEEQTAKEEEGEQEATKQEQKKPKEKGATKVEGDARENQNEEKNEREDAQEKPPVPDKKALAMPSVRKYAREQGVDISEVTGSGPHGRITREDVSSFASGDGADKGEELQAQKADQDTQAPSPKRPVAAGDRHEERVPLRGIRKAIAKAMVKSVYTAPHVTIMDEVDVTKLVELRNQAKPLAEEKGIKLTYLAFIAKAMVAGLRQFPALNASLDEETQEIVYKYYYNVGIATDTDNGLIVPVIPDADRKSIWMIADEIRDLATRGREGKLSAEELKGSTMSITNIGSAGGMFFTPVINYPEVAILGTGRITEKPSVREGEVVVAPIMALSLSFDHRIIDGATAQNFVNYVKQLLEDPQLLILEV
jgi:pyruvate dehydrogenase E2 component (dihydrolipoamide acetyltransferase)